MLSAGSLTTLLLRVRPCQPHLLQMLRSLGGCVYVRERVWGSLLPSHWRGCGLLWPHLPHLAQNLSARTWDTGAQMEWRPAGMWGGGGGVDFWEVRQCPLVGEFGTSWGPATLTGVALRPHPAILECSANPQPAESEEQCVPGTLETWGLGWGAVRVVRSSKEPCLSQPQPRPARRPPPVSLSPLLASTPFGSLFSFREKKGEMIYMCQTASHIHAEIHYF